MQGRTDDAKAVFTQLDEHAPSRYRTDPSAIVYDSADRAVVLKGRVERKEYGYAFIRFADFKEAVFTSRAESDHDEWERLCDGASICGNLAFNRRGACAVRLTSGA
jgi:hypothetical protein